MGVGDYKRWVGGMGGVGKGWGMRKDMRWDERGERGGRRVLVWKGVGMERVSWMVGEKRIKRREI